MFSNLLKITLKLGVNLGYEHKTVQVQYFSCYLVLGRGSFTLTVSFI